MESRTWTLLQKYIYLTQEEELQEINRDNGIYSPLQVIETIHLWYQETDDIIADLSDIDPYEMMRVCIQEIGEDCFKGLNRIQMRTVTEFNYERTQIGEESTQLEEELREVNKSVIKLQASVRRFLFKKYLQKTKVHHLTPLVLDFLQ